MSDTSRAIRSVRVITTGSGAGHPEHLYGTKKPTMWWVLTSRQWVTMPINVYVIEHSNGLVLFDTGVDRAVVTDPGFWPDRVTRYLMGRIFRFDIGPDDSLACRLEAAGYSPNDVDMAVLSHLHFDHAGGVSEIPNAELFVASDAWDHMLGAHPEREGVLRRDIAVPGLNWHQIPFGPIDDPELAPFDEAYDLMGDGSMMIVPTPGHLPGSVSMLLRQTGGSPILLIGDLTYNEQLLIEDRVPATGDPTLLRQSFAKVRALKQRLPDLVVLAAHDDSANEKLGVVQSAPEVQRAAAN